MIAHPIADDELETEQSKKKLEHSKQILKTVKDKLTELTDEEIGCRKTKATIFRRVVTSTGYCPSACPSFRYSI